MQSLVKTALLGTATDKFAIPPVPAALGSLLSQLDDSDATASLLSASAMVGMASLAGYLPLEADLPLAPDKAPAEALPLIPKPAAQALKRILSGEFPVLLPEFLQLTALHKKRLPPEALPAVLELGKKEPYSLVPEVIGERGRWLAGKNPAWDYVLPRDPERAWELGRRDERIAALKRLRLENPPLARQLVQNTWEQDSPEDRALFTGVFAVGLSMQDEPWLESCLDDKRKEVRSAALDLLARLPESRLVKRSLSRLEPCLKFKTGFLGGNSLEVSLPENLDTAAKRDGAGGMVLRKRLGEKANWLAQMLAVVPPSLWSQKWGKPPDKLLAAALGSEWKEPVVLGWWLATQKAHDPAWAEAFIRFRLKHARSVSKLGGESWDGIVAPLRIDQVEALVYPAVKAYTSGQSDDHSLYEMLEAVERPWSARMARAVVGIARRQAAGGSSYRLAHSLPRFALWIPPDLVDEFSAGWADELFSIWKANIDKFLAILNFRRQIHAAFER